MYNKFGKEPSMECNSSGGSSGISVTENSGGGSDSKKSPTFKQQRDILESVGCYKVGKCLGRGNFATVRAAYHETVNAKVAMKIVDRRTLDTENIIKIEREIEILQKLSHPFIVKLYQVYIIYQKFIYFYL